MGRIAAHTQEQVYEAADKLAMEGREVTPNALRDVLGRGSYSTFVKHIETWQQARQAVPVAVVIQMPESVSTSFAQAWQAAATEAGKEIAVIRQSADAEIKAVKRRLDEAIAAIEHLEAEAEADAARLESVESSLSSAQLALQQAVTDAAAREAGLVATARQMREQVESQQAELVRVHGDSEASRARHAADEARLIEDLARERAARAVEVQSAQVEVERFRHLLADAAKELAVVADRERVVIAEAATAKADVLRLVDQLKEQKTRSAEVIGKLEKSKQVLESESLNLRKEARLCASSLGRAEGELEALRSQVSSLGDTVSRLTALAGKNVGSAK